MSAALQLQIQIAYAKCARCETRVDPTGVCVCLCMSAQKWKPINEKWIKRNHKIRRNHQQQPKNVSASVFRLRTLLTMIYFSCTIYEFNNPFCRFFLLCITTESKSETSLPEIQRTNAARQKERQTRWNMCRFEEVTMPCDVRLLNQCASLYAILHTQGIHIIVWIVCEHNGKHNAVACTVHTDDMLPAYSLRSSTSLNGVLYALHQSWINVVERVSSSISRLTIATD